ncbi:hypothetical protein [Serinibacter salmoneus]|uniref:Uncharacterized protein n=1 Tax=Serinibacter salmoneus TaxID=556530 RepID=A0A2A9D488_9MICO|nr:hypothetical protein [Serinibacter salmoneus]PFG20670.1 hypothetical protein ATL40_2278 [Serinibacter salmoneus]
MSIPTRGSLRGRAAFATLGASLALVLAGCSSEALTDALESASETESTEVTEEVTKDETTPEPTQEATSEPTQEATTPEPTPTPEPEPTEDPNDFEPVTHTGVGAGVVAMPEGSDIGIVTATHEGSSNFALWSLDGDNNQVDLLVNTIGAYSGTTPWGLTYDTEASSIQVEADGPWSITFEPLLSAAELVMPRSGTGDSVLLYRGAAATPTFTHSGESNFAVWSYGDQRDLLINEIGAYSGTHAITSGPAVIVITADGDWSVE